MVSRKTHQLARRACVKRRTHRDKDEDNAGVRRHPGEHARVRRIERDGHRECVHQRAEGVDARGLRQRLKGVLDAPHDAVARLMVGGQVDLVRDEQRGPYCCDRCGEKGCGEEAVGGGAQVEGGIGERGAVRDQDGEIQPCFRGKDVSWRSAASRESESYQLRLEATPEKAPRPGLSYPTIYSSAKSGRT